MSEEAAIDARRGRWWRRALWALLALLLILVAIAGIAWIERRSIADNFIAGELAKRGVDARYTVDAIGFRRQRLTNVRIGDPTAPDAVAQWIEVDMSLGLFSGVEVTGVRIGPARLRARMGADGTISLGQIDKLLPEPSGKPFAFPALDSRIEDLRIRLETPNGVLGIKVAGEGPLDDGFSGQVGVVAPRLAAGACTVRDLRVAGDVRIADGAPALVGPATADAIDCDGTGARQLRADLSIALDEKLAAWRGSATLRAIDVAAPGVQARIAEGTVDFGGDSDGTDAKLALTARQVAGQPGNVAALTVDGQLRVAERSIFDGTIAAQGIAPNAQLRAQIAGFGKSGAGTPFAPLLDKLANAIEAAGRRADGEAKISVAYEDGRGAVAVESLSLAAASGARVRLQGDPAVALTWPGGRPILSGTLAMSGGGLPEGRVALNQAAPGAPITGRAIFAPYSAGTTRLALTPVDFSAAPGGATRIATVATFDGAVGDGRVDRLRLPIDARWNGRGTIAVNASCTPVAFDRLRIAAMTLDPTRLTLCPTGGAMLAVQGSRVTGGARTRDVRLAGRIGQTPLTLAAGQAVFGLGSRDFTLANVAARIGTAESMTRIDVAQLDGSIGEAGIGGRFSGTSGRIGQVPLALSEAAGDWRLARGVLTLEGGLRVADTAESPRFNPLVSDDVVLTLDGNRINAGGTLHLPDRGETVTTVSLRHDLGEGAGQAVLDVDDLTFAPDGLQPDALTPLTFGVIAEVAGSISGRGTIRWNAQGVTSDGTFRTAGTDLAAAFGPVRGLSTEVHFGDLLGLATPEGEVQTATVASVNPGMAVEDGVIRYRLLGTQKVAIEDGRWPFAGGTLILEPTVLDFSQSATRKMVFRVVGADAAKLMQDFDFENVDATGIFDGVLPIEFDAKGARVVGGALSSRAGGTVAYVGELTQEDLGYWGNFAFQMLKSLQYRSLDLEMNGPLDGEMVTRIRFTGVRQGEGAKSNFLIRRLTKLPIVFNITIRAPFRQLAGSVASLYDPTALVERNLPQLIKEQETRKWISVQSDESETVP